MSNRFYLSILVLSLLCCNAFAASNNNPFAKNESVNIGNDIRWKMDKETVLATKSASDNNGNYYHLLFDNKRLELIISRDDEGDNPKKFTQLEIKDVTIDGKRAPLFNWCLNNQQRHSRFLQQGLSVKKNICEVDGGAGRFVIHLSRDMLTALKKASWLSITLKPYRKSLVLNYDISDFEDMFLALNAKPEPIVAPPVALPIEPPIAVVEKKCWASPPVKYNNIKSVEYNCGDATEKNNAEKWISQQVNQKKIQDQKKAAAKETVVTEENRGQDFLLNTVEEDRQKPLAKPLKRSEVLRAEQAAIAASATKQAQLSSEITQKMLKLCNRYWGKGEHRCYCQKYIEHAPRGLKTDLTCE